MAAYFLIFSNWNNPKWWINVQWWCLLICCRVGSGMVQIASNASNLTYYFWGGNHLSKLTNYEIYVGEWLCFFIEQELIDGICEVLPQFPRILELIDRFGASVTMFNQWYFTHNEWVFKMFIVEFGENN